MNFAGVVLAILGINSSPSESFSPLPRSIALKATNLLNNYRANAGSSNMEMVVYDFEAQTKLDHIISSHSKRWMFENYTGPLPPSRQNTNGYFISEDLGYPPEFQIGWHDTCTKLGQDCVIKNFKFRIAQTDKGCIKYSLCDTLPDTYNRYRSCETNKTWQGSGNPCSYAWIYLPQMLTATVNKMACAVLETPGYAPPPWQLNSYWCYTNGQLPNNDVPFKMGEACSECPPTSPRCVNKLCV